MLEFLTEETQAAAVKATEILKKQHLNIRDARISTEDSRAVHFYVVQERMGSFVGSVKDTWTLWAKVKVSIELRLLCSSL